MILPCVFRQTDTPELYIHFRIRYRNSDFTVWINIIRLYVPLSSPRIIFAHITLGWFSSFPIGLFILSDESIGKRKKFFIGNCIVRLFFFQNSYYYFSTVIAFKRSVIGENGSSLNNSGRCKYFTASE